MIPVDGDVEITPENAVDLNILLVGLATLADEMIEKGDPHGQRLDDMLLRFYRKITGEPLERQ